MATDQNTKKKTLASETDIFYGRLTELTCPTSQESFLATLHLFLTYNYTTKPLLGNLFVVDRTFLGRLRPEVFNIVIHEN